MFLPHPVLFFARHTAPKKYDETIAITEGLNIFYYPRSIIIFFSIFKQKG